MEVSHPLGGGGELAGTTYTEGKVSELGGLIHWEESLDLTMLWRGKVVSIWLRTMFMW